MRISKPPEVRRQEIMDTAMKVFALKGYEQTTMRDIAAEVGIVPGLCYRYFESKQELFDAAAAQYIADYCAPFIRILKSVDTVKIKEPDELKSFFSKNAAALHGDDEKGQYHSFFHKSENKNFHTVLSCGICDYMLPYVKELFDALKEKSVISCDDTESLALFVLHGISAVLNDKNMSETCKSENIMRYLLKLLK
ncbi:MAG: TetR/AcrR family transcriptional regulator [Oscillospiraceae bacterium]|nr:TetR/AcrR family transcriptional regulator [Oscillospiraceae bacterium]